MVDNRKRQALTIALIVFVALLVARPLLYTHLIWPVLAKWQAWEGTVAERYERKYGPYGLHTYHLRVECADGNTRTCDVPLSLYSRADTGTTVRKEKGKRWPQIVGPPDGVTYLQDQMGDEFPERLRPVVPVEP